MKDEFIMAFLIALSAVILRPPQRSHSLKRGAVIKRSEINQALREMEDMIRKCGFPLPPFCGFTPEDWQKLGHEYDEIRDNLLGWDITDYGLGRFLRQRL